MRGLQRALLFVFIIMVAGASAFIIMQAVSGEQVGPPAALCPGPDEYGYVCDTGQRLEYIDATNDTELYLDDGLTLIELPFTFTFYGTDYDELWASSNGVLLFTTADSEFNNVCLAPQPAAGMGDMIAPYWDDLNLTADGFLETELVGQAPGRTFVVEWDDVPKFGTADDRLTFEVQLFEGSNDIVFLYQDATTLLGPNGSQATIGLQSEQQGYALQYSCNQIAIFDGNVVRFVHPEAPAVGAGLQYTPRASGLGRLTIPMEKGPAAELVAALNARGPAGLDRLRLAWLNQSPRLALDWLWSDLDGDGEREVVALWRGDASRPELVELAVIAPQSGGAWRLRFHTRPLARQDRLRSLTLASHGELTGDGGEEVILLDAAGGGAATLSQTADGYDLIELPGLCAGPLALRDANDDGIQEIVRGGCPGGQRWTIQWDGQAFAVSNRR